MDIRKIKRAISQQKCQVEGCPSQANYALYRTNPEGRKEWLYVCRLHEGVIGSENLRRAGGYYQWRKEK